MLLKEPRARAPVGGTDRIAAKVCDLRGGRQAGAPSPAKHSDRMPLKFVKSLVDLVLCIPFIASAPLIFAGIVQAHQSRVPIRPTVGANDGVDPELFGRALKHLGSAFVEI